MTARPYRDARLVPESPEKILERALAVLEGSVSPEALLRVADRWVEKWGRLAEEWDSYGPHAAEFMDGRASIYTGETYAQARDRWNAYRGLLIDHLRGPDGGGH